MNQKIKYVLSNKEGFNLIKSENSVFKSKFVFDSRPKKYQKKKPFISAFLWCLKYYLRNL